MIMITKTTRAGKNGKTIVCPYCGAQAKVFHFSWSSSVCEGCGKSVEKTDWLESPAAILGRSGGKATSEAKTAAARKNAAKPRGRWFTAIAYTLDGVEKYKSFGVVLVKGLAPKGVEAYHDWVCAKLREYGVGLRDEKEFSFIELATNSLMV